MKKQIVTMLCGAVAVALAVPAFSATTTLSGQLRTQGVIDNVQLGKKVAYRKFVSERFSPKLTIAVNDMVSVVYAGEIDLDWGVNAAATAGFDGAQSGDGVNLETKNLYTSVKLGGDYNLGFTVGLQPIADGLQNMYLRDDIAGVTVSAKAAGVDLGAGWLKIAEAAGSASALFDASPTAPQNANATSLNDDWDIWFVKAGFVPAEGSKAGVELYRGVRNINSNNDNTLMTVAVTGATKVADFGIDGFIAMQTGEDNINGNAEDRSAIAASALISKKFSDVLSGDLRLIYISADTDEDQDNQWQYQYAAGGHMLNFIGSNMNIMFANAYKTGVGSGFRDNLFTTDLIPTGVIGGVNTAGVQSMNSFGMIGAIANAQYNFAPYYFKGAVGYFMTASKKADFGGQIGEVELDSTNLGLELFGQVGTKLADGANVYLRGDYLMIGSAFDDTAKSNSATWGEDPYNPWMLSLGVDVPF